MLLLRVLEELRDTSPYGKHELNSDGQPVPMVLTYMSLILAPCLSLLYVIAILFCV